MREPFEHLVARLNASAYIPPPDPTECREKLRKVMAKEFKLPKSHKEFTFKSAAAASKYPWDEWFSGKLLLLERSDVDKDGNLTPSGEKRDFEVERDAMPAKIKTAARRRYKVVQISKRDHEGKPLEHDGLIIKARDMMADERQAEDVLRAEEKAARKADKDTTAAPATPQLAETA
jgi:hypothetical protein